MRIAFAGTPEFAAATLAAILDEAPRAGWAVPLVLTQPDRPTGRGLRTAPSAVRQLASAHGIEVATPASLRKGEAAMAVRERLREVAPDVLVVAAYGLILPADVLDLPRGLRREWNPRLTAVNVHASLLPRWRGAAPIARAIEAGDAATGITIMQMEAGLDTGPMLKAESVAIEPFDTTVTLTQRLASLGGRLLVDALRDVERLIATPQPDAATYAHKLDKAEAWLDWSLAAETLERKLRAFDPFPVAASQLRGATVRLWRGEVAAGAAHQPSPGTVIDASDKGVSIACGSGSLVVTELQRSGGKRLAAGEFMRGFPIAVGEQFRRPPPA